MKAHNLILVIFTLCFAANFASACNDFEIFNCNKDVSQEFSKRIYRQQAPYDESKECGENEVYHIAGVTNHCAVGCESGCVCKPGYARVDSKGGCVLVEDTNLKCNKTEVIMCGKSECEKNCELDMDPLCKVNYYDCKYSYSCYCKPGFIRVGLYKCIPVDKCPTLILSKPMKRPKVPDFWKPEG